MDGVGGEWAPKGWLSHSTMSVMDPPTHKAWMEICAHQLDP